MTVYVDNTNALVLDGLHDELTDAYINAATVAAVVKKVSDNSEVVPSLSMTYVAGSEGVYRGILVDTLSLVAETQYYALITANGGANKIGKWKFFFTAKERIG